jgi:hypothetical protein
MEPLQKFRDIDGFCSPLAKLVAGGANYVDDCRNARQAPVPLSRDKPACRIRGTRVLWAA